jgi:transaldolase
LTIHEFDDYGPTTRTLRQFLEAGQELSIRVRDIILPNPDILL